MFAGGCKNISSISLYVVEGVTEYLDHICIVVIFFFFFFSVGFSAVGDIIVMATFQSPHLLCHL